MFAKLNFVKADQSIILLPTMLRDESGCKFRNWNYGKKLEERTKRFLIDGVTYAGED